MKGIFAVVLIGLVVAVSGVACGGSAEPTPTPQPSSPSPPPPAPLPIVGEPPSPTAEPTLHPDPTSEEARGMDLANKQGCLGCHTTDGTALIGPSWKGLFGRDEELEDGTTVKVDEAYIAESIREPGARITKGFTSLIMPDDFGSLSQEDINAIIAYMKSLK